MSDDKLLFGIGTEVRLSMENVIIAHEEIADQNPLLRIIDYFYDDEANCYAYETEYYDENIGQLPPGRARWLERRVNVMV